MEKQEKTLKKIWKSELKMPLGFTERKLFLTRHDNPYSYFTVINYTSQMYRRTDTLTCEGIFYANVNISSGSLYKKHYLPILFMCFFENKKEFIWQVILDGITLSIRSKVQPMRAELALFHWKSCGRTNIHCFCFVLLEIVNPATIQADLGNYIFFDVYLSNRHMVKFYVHVIFQNLDLHNRKMSKILRISPLMPWLIWIKCHNLWKTPRQKAAKNMAAFC